MIKWYNLYSYWTAILCILSYFRLVPFSVIPSVLGTITGTLVLLYLKIREGRPVGLTFVTLQIVLHLFSLFILPVRFTPRDVYINLFIFAVFNLWLLLQGETFVSTYKPIVYEDGRLSLGEYLRKRSLVWDTKVLEHHES
jgi:hypothetical protein